MILSPPQVYETPPPILELIHDKTKRFSSNRYLFYIDPKSVTYLCFLVLRNLFDIPNTAGSLLHITLSTCYTNNVTQEAYLLLSRQVVTNMAVVEEKKSFIF